MGCDKDIHLLLATDVVVWALVKQVAVPFPSLVQRFITFLLEVADFFKLFFSLRWWIIPLDKGLFKEIPGVNGTWSEPVHPSFSGSNECDGENTKHDCIVCHSQNIKQTNDV
ncbi:hypothetical protein Tco_0715916 [Tanacetum coccineum]